MREQIIQTADGQKIAVLSDNQSAGGAPIVFVHGILGSIRFWPPILPPRIRESTRWFSISLPGHHPARFPCGFRAVDFTSQRFAETFEEVFNVLFGDEPVSIVGYSTGGFAALNHAVHFPRRVANVLSIAGFSNGRWPGSLGLLQRLARRGAIGRLLFKKIVSILTGNFRLFEWIHQTARVQRQSQFDAVVHETLQAVFQDSSRHNAADLRILFERLRGINILDELQTIRAKTLIVVGDRDKIASYEHAKELAGAIPNAELVTFNGSGHLFFADCLTEYQGLLTDWVDGLAELELSLEVA